MKKFVFIDIDGTLYDREDPRGIPQSTVQAIRELQRAGNLAMICTGRCMSCVEPYIRDIGFDGYIAGCGTHIIYKKQELWYQTLSADLIRKVDRLCKEEQVMPVFEGSQYLYVDESDCTGENLRFYHFYEQFYKGKVRSIDHDAKDVCKFTVRLNPDDRCDAKKRRLAASLTKFGLEILDKGHSLEVYPCGSGKGEGIRRFLTLTGYEQADTYAFGDGVNDITMMEQVRFGIALGHADSRLLHACCCETDDLYENGIFNACKKLHLIP